jgi:hypothetical protein
VPDPVGPQPVESREAYDEVVADYRNAQQNGSNLPPVAYDQPGQILTPEQLPDPLVNIRAGFAPQDLSSVVVVGRGEALAHPPGPEANDPVRLDIDIPSAAKFAAENAEEYDENQRLANLSAPERDQAAGRKDDHKGTSASASSPSSSSSPRPNKS